MTTDLRAQPPPGDRLPPELAIAALDLRQLSLLAAYPLLTAVERQGLSGEHARAASAASTVLAQRATRTDCGPAEVARMFFGLYYVFPNLGLAGPFFDDDVRPLKEMVWIAAYDALFSGVPVRHEFHARLWDHICDEERRARAARRYAQDRSLHSYPPSADPHAVERYRRRIDALMTSAECVPALLATWAIESHPQRLDDLATGHLRGKHGLLELRDMARFMGVKPNTLSQSLRRFRARLGEEMRVLWGIERTAAVDEDEDR